MILYAYPQGLRIYAEHVIWQIACSNNSPTSSDQASRPRDRSINAKRMFDGVANQRVTNLPRQSGLSFIVFLEQLSRIRECCQLLCNNTEIM